jgi:hypothetical protein
VALLSPDYCKQHLADYGESNSHYYRFLETSNEVGAIISDHNILFYKLGHGLARTRQIAGYNEEVLDAIFVGANDEKVAVVTNTDQVGQKLLQNITWLMYCKDPYLRSGNTVL